MLISFPGSAADEVVVLKREALDAGQRREKEVMVSLPQGVSWYGLRVEPLATRPDRGILCVAIDITKQKEAEQHLKLIMNELSHRVKNIIMVVQAMMAQTARRSTDMAEFLKAFSGRLFALSRGHDQLLQRE